MGWACLVPGSFLPITQFTYPKIGVCKILRRGYRIIAKKTFYLSIS